MAGPAAAPVETQYFALVWRRKILRLYVDAMKNGIGDAIFCVSALTPWDTQDVASVWRRKILRLYVDTMKNGIGDGDAIYCVGLETQDIASLPSL